jgi:hypothetical protein
LPGLLARLREQRIPPRFIDSYALMEKTLSKIALSREEVLRRTDSSRLTDTEREKLRGYFASDGHGDALSTGLVYGWVLRHASKMHAPLDPQLITAALKVLEGAKREQLPQIISSTVNSSGEADSTALAGYLRTAGGLLLEGEAGQATHARFQEVTHGAVAGWIFRNFLLGTGVPVRFEEPDGVAGPEFAELLDRLTPKNKRSGNSFRGKSTAEIEFIHEGQELHQNLVEVINSAQSLLNLTTLDWKRDMGGKEIAYRLMAKKLGLDGRAFEDFLDAFRRGLPLDPGGQVSGFYDLPPNRIKNLLSYYFFRTSQIPEVADSRRLAEELLGGELQCPSLAKCGDLSALLEQARGHDPGRGSDQRYGKMGIVSSSPDFAHEVHERLFQTRSHRGFSPACHGKPALHLVNHKALGPQGQRHAQGPGKHFLGFLSRVEAPNSAGQGKGIPGVGTIPAIFRSSWYSASLMAEISSLTFFSNFIFLSAVFARISSSVTCRGSFSNARKSATRFLPLWSCGSGYGSRVTSAME